MSGITETGFDIKSLDEIKSDIEAAERAAFSALGVEIDLSSSAVLNTINSTISEKIFEVWEVLKASYASQSPDQATANALVNIAAICPGILKLGAARTVIPAVLSLNAGVTVPAGSLVHPDGYPTYKFRTVDAVTNSGGSPDDFDVNIESVEYGKFIFTTTTLIIDSPVSGWTAAAVTESGAYVTMGRLEETDNELRIRREQMIRASGSSTVEAIRADILAVDTENILDVAVEENETDSPVNGLVPKSIRVIVWDGESHPVGTADIAEAIFNTKAAGIATNGEISEDVEDEMGYSHTILFDYPSVRDIYINYSTDTEKPGGTVIGNNAPPDWIEQIDTKLLSLMLEQHIGEDVSYSRLLGGIMQAFGYGLPMSEDLPSGGWLISLAGFEIGFTSSGDTVDLVIDPGEIATLEADNINA